MFKKEGVSMLWFLPEPVRNFIEDTHLQAPVIIAFFVLVFFLILKLRDVTVFSVKRANVKKIVKKHADCATLVNKNALFLGGKHGTDFYIRTPNEILAVKVFGNARRNVEYCFDDEGYYYKQKYIAVPYARGIKLLPLGFGKRKKFPEIDFAFRAKELGMDEKWLVPAVLFSPAPHLLTRGADVENKIRDGKRWNVTYQFKLFDNLNGMIVLDGHSLKSVFSCIETGVSPIEKNT